MDVLWAPWRMTYILDEDKAPGCIFCLAAEGKGEAPLTLGQGENTVVLANKYPYINGHLLVAPTRHVPDMSDLSEKELSDLLTTVHQATVALKKVMNPDGFNVGLNLGRVAGAGIEEHMHFHVVPRWNGDTNFMTVFADVRVIPQHIEDTCRQLAPHFEQVR